MDNRNFTFDDAAEALVEQIQAIRTGEADLRNAEAQANVVGKWVKVRALELATAMFIRAGGALKSELISAKDRKAIA